MEENKNTIENLKKNEIKDEVLDLKLDYLLRRYQKRNTITTYFRMFRMFVLPVEISLNKELKEMTEDEVECMVNNITTTSLRIKTSLKKLCVNYRSVIDSNNTEL